MLFFLANTPAATRLAPTPRYIYVLISYVGAQYTILAYYILYGPCLLGVLIGSVIGLFGFFGSVNSVKFFLGQPENRTKFKFGSVLGLTRITRISIFKKKINNYIDI